jgi:hypothetical protein
MGKESSKPSVGREKLEFAGHKEDCGKQKMDSGLSCALYFRNK